MKIVRHLSTIYLQLLLFKGEYTCNKSVTWPHHYPFLRSYSIIPYICVMGLIEFINSHRDCLNIRGIEKRLDMPKYFLQDALNGKRILPKKYGGRLISYFGGYGIELIHVEKRKRIAPPVVFDLTGWTKVYGRNWEKDERVVKLDKDGFYLCDVD